MTDRDASTLQPRDPRADLRIELAASSRGIGFGHTAAPGLGVRLRISARGHHAPGEGWALWRLEKDGSTAVLNHWTHQLPWGEFDWLSEPFAHDGRSLRLFASRSQLDPTRVSDFVDVDIPDMPPPTEVTARDGSRRVIFTGTTLPGTRVRCTLDGRTIESAGEEKFQLIMEGVAEGTYAYSAVTLPFGDAGQSSSVTGSVTVAAPPAIPLALQFPEEGRRIPRVERVTGVAVPGSEMRVRLGEGAPETTRANEGGAWETRVRSERHGPVKLLAENLTTGEVVQRDVDVEYFPQWQVTRLIAGALVDENGLVARRGAIAEGTGDAGTLIEILSRKEFVPLATVGDDGTWSYRVLDDHGPFLFMPGKIRLRAAGDPVEVEFVAEPQRPLILQPRQGELVEGDVVISGIAGGPVHLEFEGGKVPPAKPDPNNHFRWEVKLGPLPPGLHTITARVHPKAVREHAYSSPFLRALRWRSMRKM